VISLAMKMECIPLVGVVTNGSAEGNEKGQLQQMTLKNLHKRLEAA